MNKPSYIVFCSYPKCFKVIRQDDINEPVTRIGTFTSKREAMQCARLLAGRQGRVAFTHDVITYPW